MNENYGGIQSYPIDECEFTNIRHWHTSFGDKTICNATMREIVQLVTA